MVSRPCSLTAQMMLPKMQSAIPTRSLQRLEDYWPRKSLEEFDFDHARRFKRDMIAHPDTLDFVTARDNAVFPGPPGTGKTHLAIGLEQAYPLFTRRQAMHCKYYWLSS